MRFAKQANDQDGGLTTNRIEAFSDGVFAIAITLLILEIRLPTQAEASHASVAASLLAIWPFLFCLHLQLCDGWDLLGQPSLHFQDLPEDEPCI